METMDFGKASELTFWKNLLKDKDENWAQFMIKEEAEVGLNEIQRTFNKSGTDVKVLELGPGPRSRLTEGWDRDMFTLMAVDPLADYYKNEFKGKPFLWQGNAEDIKRMFPHNYFDMVFASNSIDHSTSPEKIIEGVSEVLRVGGVLIVCGNEKEGTRAKWVGMHKHNLWIEGGKLMWETQKTQPKPILPDKYVPIQVRSLNYNLEGDAIQWFSGVWKKTS